MPIDSYLITYTLWSSTVSLVDSYLACGVCLLCSLLYVWSFLRGWSLLHSVMFYGNLHRQLMMCEQFHLKILTLAKIQR